MNVPWSRVAQMLIGVAVLGTLFYWFFLPPDEAYYKTIARRTAAQCLTAQNCGAVLDNNQIMVARPPLRPASRCAKDTNLAVRDWKIDKDSGYGFVLMYCADGAAGFLVRFATTRDAEDGSTLWLRCRETSCKADAARFPPLTTPSR